MVLLVALLSLLAVVNAIVDQVRREAPSFFFGFSHSQSWPCG